LTNAFKLGAGLFLFQQLAGDVKQFADQSEIAFRKQEDVRNALTDLVGGSEAYNAAIGAIQTSTRGMMSETKAAQAALVFLKSGLADNSEEAGRLSAAGNALSATYKAQGATFEKFIRLLSGGSPMLFDNFNITLEQVNALKAQIMATEGLSSAEAKQAAIKRIVLREGERLLGTLSDETVAAQQNIAAYENLQATFGELVAGGYEATREVQTEFFRELTEAIGGVNNMIEVLGNMGVTLQDIGSILANGLPS
jgi:hypothetical protein